MAVVGIRGRPTLLRMEGRPKVRSCDSARWRSAVLYVSLAQESVQAAQQNFATRATPVPSSGVKIRAGVRRRLRTMRLRRVVLRHQTARTMAKGMRTTKLEAAL